MQMKDLRNRVTTRFSAVALALALGSAPFRATPADSTRLDELEEVVVVERLPGPPLWKISKGEHAIAFGDVKLLAKSMEEASTSAAFGSWEVACLEKTLAYFEKDIEAVKKRANAWAQGRADDLIDPAPLHGRGNACDNPPMIPDGSPAMAKLRKEAPGLAALLVDNRSESERISRERWLAAAEAALARNMHTFSVLHVNDILDQDGLISQLHAKGYTVGISAR